MFKIYFLFLSVILLMMKFSNAQFAQIDVNKLNEKAHYELSNLKITHKLPPDYSIINWRNFIRNNKRMSTIHGYLDSMVTVYYGYPAGSTPNNQNYTIYTYDSLNRIKSSIEYYYDQDSLKYIAYNKDEFYYSPDNLSELYVNTFLNNNQYDTGYYCPITLDSSGNEIKVIICQGGFWDTMYVSDFSYDNFNRKTAEILSGIINDNTIKPYLKRYYTYTGTNTTSTTFNEYSLNYQTMQWDFTYKDTVIFNQQHNPLQTLGYIPKYGQWCKYTKNEITYNSTGLLPLTTVNSVWDTLLNSFVNDSKYTIIYDLFNNPDSFYFYQWKKTQYTWNEIDAYAFTKNNSYLLEDFVYNFLPEPVTFTNLLLSSTKLMRDSSNLLIPSIQRQYYYRFTNPNGIEDNNNDKFSIYPNPTTEFFNIYGFEENPNYEIQIYNQFGKLVFIKKQNSGKVSLPNIESGIYMVKITGAEKSKVFKLIIK